MIPSIMKIGKWIGKNEGTTGSISNFVQNPNEKGTIRNVITIDLKYEYDSCSFINVDIEEFRQKYLLKYLYRHGSARGADITPTSKFAGDMAKTFKNKILKSIQDISKDGKNLGLDSAEQDKIRLIEKALSSDEDRIIEKLQIKAEDIGEREGAIITLAFHENGEKQYIGEIDLFKKALIGKAKENYYKQYGKKSLGNNRECFVCQEKRSEVFGFVNTYNFYTVDKPGFVTGGFDQKDAWKNYPVCLDCAGDLELGKKYLSSKLIFSFYGYRYILIPKFFSDQIIEDTLEALEYTFERRDNAMIQASFEKTYINRITNAEDEILEYISESKNYVSFDLLFYQEKQAAFNILLHVEDVLPSRFRKLFEAKARIDELSIFKNMTYPDTGKRALFFNFGVLRRFFPFISKTQSYDKHFLELTGKIFSFRPIDYYFIIKAIVRILRSKFVRDKYLKTDCLSGYLLLNYLADLRILSKGGKYMEIQPIEELKESFGSDDTSISEKIDLFFKAHSGFFDNTEKKACFLVGLLVQKLLNIQIYQILKGKSSNESSTAYPAEGESSKTDKKKKVKPPFMKKLQGLHLTEPIIKRICFEAQHKLEQYDQNYKFKALESLIAQYMVAAKSKWAITNDEIAFYFTMGMNLNDLFKTVKEEGQDDGSNE